MADDKKKIIIGAVAIAAITGLLLWKKGKAAPGIVLSNLSIIPDTVNMGQEVTISVTATNNAASQLTQSINLGGDFTATQQVTINPGESQVVSFTVTPTVAKTYQVSLNGLSGSFVCTTAGRIPIDITWD